MAYCSLVPEVIYNITLLSGKALVLGNGNILSSLILLTISVKLPQPLKALLPIEVRPAGKENNFKLVQF